MDDAHLPEVDIRLLDATINNYGKGHTLQPVAMKTTSEAGGER